MNRIKALREDRDLRQLDVAQATGIDQRTLSNYETGKTNPDSFAIVRLADYFGVSADYLLGRETPRTAELDALRAKLHTVQTLLEEIETHLT